jgi:hypothetical protein
MAGRHVSNVPPADITHRDHQFRKETISSHRKLLGLQKPKSLGTAEERLRSREFADETLWKKSAAGSVDRATVSALPAQAGHHA